MSAFLLLYGCNTYKDPNANLHGCVDDLENVADICTTKFNKLGWDVKLEINAKNTAAKIKALWADIAAKAVTGDVVWGHNSSHGTTIPIKGVKHHATVPYDFDWDNLDTFMLDTDYWKAFAAFKPGVILTFTSDSCFSEGLTATRSLLHAPTIQNRFLECPVVDAKATDAHARSLQGNKLEGSFGFGCGKDQTSADVVGPDGRAYGAYTETLLNRVRATPTATFLQSHVDCNKDLKENQFEQVSATDGTQIVNPWHGGLLG